MKKSLFFAAAVALTFAACQPSYDVEDKTVATFEEAAISPAATESVMHLAQTGTFESGNFVFTQEVSVSEWGTYYYGNIVTNKTANEYKGDFQNDMSAKGGAHGGKNFVVWTGSYIGADGITLKQAAVVPGMYVCNTPWVVDAILKGDGMSDDEGAPFGEEDYFTLTVSGYLNGEPTSNSLVSLFNPYHVCCLLCNYSKLKEDCWGHFDNDWWYLMEDFDNLSDENARLMEQIQNQQKRRQMSGMTR